MVPFLTGDNASLPNPDAVSNPGRCSPVMDRSNPIVHTFVSGACRGQKRVLDPLGLELHTDVSCSVGPGTSTWVFWNISQCF